MKATAKSIGAVSSEIASRVEAIDWTQATADLDAQGCAVLKRLLSPDECRALAALYADDARFRSKIVMGRHGFGRGEYKYFSYPLPDPIAELRPALYGRLAAVANRWNQTMGIDVSYPPTHQAFLKRRHGRQTRPTPLLLQYGEATTTACTRTSMASTCSRCRSRSCCRNRGGFRRRRVRADRAAAANAVAARGGGAPAGRCGGVCRASSPRAGDARLLSCQSAPWRQPHQIRHRHTVGIIFHDAEVSASRLDR